MSASSRGFSAQFDFKLRRFDVRPLYVLDPRKRRRSMMCYEGDRLGVSRIACSCSDSVVPIRRTTGSGNRAEKKTEERRFDSKKSPHGQRIRAQASPAMPFASPQSQSKQEKFYPRCTPRNSGPQSRDTPPKRDTGIANEKDWGINLLNENVKESGTNEDGSTWYRESGEDLGENGYRCRWTRMGGRSHDGSSEWKETWWEKSDWTGIQGASKYFASAYLQHHYLTFNCTNDGYMHSTPLHHTLKELGQYYIIVLVENSHNIGVEKSGTNAEGDSWWETWQEVLHQDEWSNIAKIERSAQKQAKSGTENAGWYEKWWEKYDAKGWTEKGAHKYGRLNEQSWWEKWGEHYDGRGSVLKWTDKWAETELGTKWGDKWEEKFFAGIGSRQGETWHVSPSGERWSRTWGEEHFGNGKVHKYGKSTTGESWDIDVDEETYYEAEPHYGWADVVGDSSQLLSIETSGEATVVFTQISISDPLRHL
ncbi:Inactive purple acid phosphatase-like protein [Quillaja saponaria]|uniref:Inactive purple acid phosphatase-like protein n=1 Tax=Quillaja saponaria TaxID=32244 RepID=A0AAD7LZ72_QUISA|nr:Inactive purple acid phosphatase-like protein [Quillaja saponaria]